MKKYLIQMRNSLDGPVWKVRVHIVAENLEEAYSIAKVNEKKIHPDFYYECMNVFGEEETAETKKSMKFKEYKTTAMGYEKQFSENDVLWTEEVA